MPREVWDVGKVRQESQRERDISAQSHRDAMRAHRDAMEERAARETAKKQAREGRREANRSAAAARRADRAKARQKSDRSVRLLEDTISSPPPQEETRYGMPSQKVSGTIQASGPTPSVAGPMDYLGPSLTDPQGAALSSLGSPTALETAGATVGAATDNLIAKIREDATPGAGGWFSPYYDEIVMPTTTFQGRNLDQITRHELMHRLVEELTDSGVLRDIPLPEMQGILEKFDNFTGEATVQDFIDFMQMNNPSPSSDIVPATGEYWDDWAFGVRRVDPRSRTIGWDYSGIPKIYDDQGRFESYNIETGPYDQAPNFAKAPWAGSSARGKQDWDDWMAFQRELPSEAYGAAVMGHQLAGDQGWLNPGDEGYNELIGTGAARRPIGWGPSVVNYRWHQKADEDDWTQVPVSTGLVPMGMKGTPSWQDAQPYIDEAGDYWGGLDYDVGLGNWPMGDEHALLAAQAARFDLPGQQDYVSPTGETGSYYGNLARFNRAAALKAHPDSRIRAITEAGLPDIVMDKLTEVLSTGDDEVWGQAGSFEGAVKYVNQLIKEYQSMQAGQVGSQSVVEN